MPADVSVEEEVKNMIERTVENLGRLDVVPAPFFYSAVGNCADGVMGMLITLLRRWWRTHELVKRAPFSPVCTYIYPNIPPTFLCSNVSNNTS